MQFVYLCFTHHSSILWPPDAKNWLIGKDPNAGKDWKQKDKGMALDEMARRHQWLSGHEQTPGDSERQGGLACCSPCGGRVRDDLMSNTTKILEKSFFFNPWKDTWFMKSVLHWTIPSKEGTMTTQQPSFRMHFNALAVVVLRTEWEAQVVFWSCWRFTEYPDF